MRNGTTVRGKMFLLCRNSYTIDSGSKRGCGGEIEISSSSSHCGNDGLELGGGLTLLGDTKWGRELEGDTGLRRHLGRSSGAGRTERIGRGRRSKIGASFIRRLQRQQEMMMEERRYERRQSTCYTHLN